MKQIGSVEVPWVRRSGCSRLMTSRRYLWNRFKTIISTAPQAGLHILVLCVRSFTKERLSANPVPGPYGWCQRWRIAPYELAEQVLRIQKMALLQGGDKNLGLVEPLINRA